MRHPVIKSAHLPDVSIVIQIVNCKTVIYLLLNGSYKWKQIKSCTINWPKTTFEEDVEAHDPLFPLYVTVIVGVEELEDPVIDHIENVCDPNSQSVVLYGQASIYLLCLNVHLALS